MGPFMGCRVFTPLPPLIVAGASIASLMLMGFAIGSASGLPRSQARLSLSPKGWQLEQAASPFEELMVAS